MPKNHIAAMIIAGVGLTVSTLNQFVWETSTVVAIISLTVIIFGVFIGPFGEAVIFFSIDSGRPLMLFGMVERGNEAHPI